MLHRELQSLETPPVTQPVSTQPPQTDPARQTAVESTADDRQPPVAPPPESDPPAQLEPEARPQAEPSRAAPQPTAEAEAQPARELPPLPLPPPQASRGERTLAYWNKMNDVIAQEEAKRAVPAGGVTTASAAEFLNRRIGAAKYAVGALKELDTKDVDPLATDFVETLGAWYGEGVAINEEGKRLLEQESAEARRGAAGLRWQTSYKHHEQGVQQINAAGARVRDMLEKKYGLAFPPLR
jgi:hypothetical protein